MLRKWLSRQKKSPSGETNDLEVVLDRLLAVDSPQEWEALVQACPALLKVHAVFALREMLQRAPE